MEDIVDIITHVLLGLASIILSPIWIPIVLLWLVGLGSKFILEKMRII